MENLNQKSKVGAGLMALLIGSLGIHNFYLKQVSRGITKIAILILGMALLFNGTYKDLQEQDICYEMGISEAYCETSDETLQLLGIGTLLIYIPTIWSVVEGVMILTGKINKDALGNPIV